MKPVDFFKCLSDETRLRVLCLLFGRRELCVCEITHALAVSQPKISRHLALLRAHGLLQDRRRGAWVYYRLHPALPEWAQSVLCETAAAMTSNPHFREDEIRLNAMTDRPGAAGCCEDELKPAPDYFSPIQLKENPS